VLPIWRRVAFLCLSLLLASSSACKRVVQSYSLHKYDEQIAQATRDLAGNDDDSSVVNALTVRGRAYAEKARLLASTRSISAADYDRLIGRAIADQARAISRLPHHAEPYAERGQTYYERGTVVGLDREESPDARGIWLLLAQTDFTRALERRPHYAFAFDMRARARAALGDWDGVIADLTELTKIDGAAQGRLADAYCSRGEKLRVAKDYEGAIADFEKSISLGATREGSSCDPFALLAAVYLDGTHAYDKARDVLRRARDSKRKIPKDLEQRLSRPSR